MLKGRHRHLHGRGAGCGFRRRLRMKARRRRLDNLPVNLRPERGKVIDARNQRNTRPQTRSRRIRDPVDREDEVTVNRPFFPTVVEYHRDHGNNLHHHLELAQFAGFDSKAPRSQRDGTQPAHQELAANDDHRDPGGNQAGIELHQGNERGSDQKFVGHADRKQNPHSRDLPARFRASTSGIRQCRRSWTRHMNTAEAIILSAPCTLLN